MGVLDEIKAILSPAGAWLWAELGKMYLISSCFDNRNKQAEAEVMPSSNLVKVEVEVGLLR